MYSVVFISGIQHSDSVIYLYIYFLGGSDGKESACNARDTDSLAFMGQEDPLEEDIATHSVFLPGEFYRRTNLVGYSPWAHKE